MRNNIGYHTRLYNNATVKVCGGSFGGNFDMETVNRLVNSHLNVAIKPSGQAVFTDRDGREVRLYVSVDACKTEKGKVALRAHRESQAAQREQERKKALEIEELMANLSDDEIIERLK